MKVKNLYICIVIICIVSLSCNKRSILLDYNEILISYPSDGYTRDMFINNDSLFVVNELDGLVVYKINEEETSSSLNILYSDTSYFSNYNLSGLQFSSKLNKIFLIDKFYSIFHIGESEIFEVSPSYQKIGGFSDSHHPSKISINELDEKVELYTLIRNVSGLEGIPTDIVSIYKVDITSSSIGSPIKIIDSLNYNTTDIFYEKKLFISNTSRENYELSIYKKENKIIEYDGECDSLSGQVVPVETPFAIDIIGNECIYFILDNKISTSYIPKAVKVSDDLLFIGMGDHGGVKIYDINSLDEMLWFAQGFSVRNIYYSPQTRRIIMSCGYQGVVVSDLNENLSIVDTKVITTSYAYTARIYSNYLFASTRNGIEIIKIN